MIMNRTASVIVATLILTGVVGGPRSNAVQAGSASSNNDGNLQPVRIAIMQDKTASTNSTRTQQLQLKNLDVLLELLKHNGGEICFGLIRDNSNRPLVRLRIEEPPAKPPKKSAIAAAKDRIEYDKADAKHNAASALRIQSFKDEIKPLLQQKANALRTDIWGAVARADLCLSEDDSSWRQKPRRYLVISSDGQQDANTKYVPMKSDAEIIFVYGSPNLGSLEKLNPTRFESAEAAFRYIDAQEGGK